MERERAHFCYVCVLPGNATIIKRVLRLPSVGVENVSSRGSHVSVAYRVGTHERTVTPAPALFVTYTDPNDVLEMEKLKKKAKKYCAVFNCLNTDCDPHLTFFRLPSDDERCRKWLTLIDRLDLLKKAETHRKSYLVCSAHFEDSSIKIIKHLHENALPSILLPDLNQEGSSCSENQSPPSQGKATISSKEIKKECSSEIQSTSALNKDKETQTESLQPTGDQKQTSNSLFAQTPRKRKLLKNEINNESEIREFKIDQEIIKIKKEL